jgi:hypothetical protein
MRAMLIMFTLAAFAANAGIPAKPVNLDKPGALEALEKENPDHFRTVMERVRAVGVETCESAARLYRTQPEQRRAACRSRQLRTTFPAQTTERIRVDQSIYVITVFLDPSTYKIIPAR